MQAFSKGKSAVYPPFAGHPETQRPCHLEAVVVCANVAGLGRIPSCGNRPVPPSATLNTLIRCFMSLEDSWLQLPFSPVPSANIQVAGDAHLLQVFVLRGRWHKFSPDAQPWTPAPSFRARCCAVRVTTKCRCRALTALQPASRCLVLRVPGGFRCRLTPRAQRTKRPATVHQIRPSLPWCSTLPALRRKLCRGFCL